MTRKHFVDLAEALHNIQPASPVGNNDGALVAAAVIWNAAVRATGDVCDKHNDRFNRDAFVAACGGLVAI